MTEKLLVINCAALSFGLARAIADDQSLLEGRPSLAAFIGESQIRPLKPVFPAVTMSVQASMLTGQPPSVHGCVSNSRLNRRTLRYDSWEQSALLLDARPFWQEDDFAGKTVATICWQFAFHSGANFVVTPAPIHARDGSTIAAIQTEPEELGEVLEGEFGAFPLKNYWGPFAGIQATEWILQATKYIMLDYSPDVVLTYIPHLDYVLQRETANSAAARKELDALLKNLDKLIYFASRKKYKIAVISEYGITEVERAIHVNRALRKAGLLQVRKTAGIELIDTYKSRAWALVDHQIAHVFVRNPDDIPATVTALEKLDGVEEIAVGTAKAELGVEHPNSGDIVLVAKNKYWFNYHFWMNEATMPPYARTVDIHSKPGYDPLELFFNRTTMTIETKNTGMVRGSHGRIPESEDNFGVLITRQSSSGPAGQALGCWELPGFIRSVVL